MRLYGMIPHAVTAIFIIRPVSCFKFYHVLQKSMCN